jgi:hypothetical protein
MEKKGMKKLKSHDTFIFERRVTTESQFWSRILNVAHLFPNAW